MRRTLSHRLYLLVLAAILGLGLSLSVVQAGTMSVEMAMAAMPPEAGSDPCGACDGSGDGQVDTSFCLSVCGSTAHALLVAEPAAPLPAHSPRLRPGDPPIGGDVAGPDPGPPRALILG